LNLFELFVKIGVDDQASGKLSKLSSGLGKGLATAAKIGTAAVGAAAAGITALTKAAVDNYAEYEQLVGGVQTLFSKSKSASEDFADSIRNDAEAVKEFQKAHGLVVDGILGPQTMAEIEKQYGQLEDIVTSSADVVIKNASEAFRTAGLSANQYMETVTSFSASLIASLGGDTAKAADYADKAIIDMADNANKMGTDISLIQNAYQGFAKQNYTMLDNLKLGYGGTQAEMIRLLKDADALSEAFNLVEDENGDLVYSFADIVEAIHIVQDDMGIAGATALEAGITIEGSVNSMKAAWSNLVTGFADGNADIEGLINNLVTTIVGDGTENNLGVIGNVLPAIETALGGVAKLIEGAAPKIIEILPGLVTKIVPSLISAATGMVNAVVKVVPDLLDTVVDAIIDNAPALIDSAIVLIGELSSGILGQLPQIVKLGLDLIVSLANGIVESLPELIPTIVDVVLQIVDTLTNPDTLSSLVDASIAIIMGLADGLIEALPDLLEKAPEIVQNLVDALIENVPKLLTVAVELILKFVEYLTTPENLNAISETALELINSLVDGFGNFLESLIDVGEDIVEKIEEGISNAWEGLKEWFNGLWDSLFGNRTVDVDVDTSGGAPSSRANGLSYVPYDGYYSVLHKGERVLTAEENKAYNAVAKGNTSGITIIQNIQSVPQTPVEFAAATEAYFEQARWAFA
jgi:phage-related protein